MLLDLFDVKAYSIEYLTTELIKTNKYNKVGIVDMFLRVDDEIVILELQNINRHNFKERLLFYSSNIISNYCLKVGEDYSKLRSIKLYSIINYSLFNEDVKEKINLKRKNEIFTNRLEYQIFDLTKIDKNDRENKYYEIVNLFVNNNDEELDTKIQNDIYKEILKDMKKYNLKREDRENMDDIAKMMMEEKEHYETAYYVGMEEGINQGINQGIVEGIYKGINQRNNEIARNMLEEKVDINLISKYTDLSIDEINSLKEN